LYFSELFKAKAANYILYWFSNYEATNYAVFYSLLLYLSIRTKYSPHHLVSRHPLPQWYSTFFVHVPPDIISLQLRTPKVVGRPT
jgi:hypothetical protein